MGRYYIVSGSEELRIILARSAWVRRLVYDSRGDKVVETLRNMHFAGFASRDQARNWLKGFATTRATRTDVGSLNTPDAESFSLGRLVAGNSLRKLETLTATTKRVNGQFDRVNFHVPPPKLVLLNHVVVRLFPHKPPAR